MSILMQKLVKTLILPLSITLLVACASTPEPATKIAVTKKGSEASSSIAGPVKSSGRIALDAARKMLGVSYRYGGAGPRGFDCSGLVQYSFSHAGVRLPRTSRDIFRSSQLVNPKDMQPGDLVFFTILSNKVSHVGIYADHSRFIHSPSSGKGVSYASLGNPYWQERLVGVGRF